MFSSKVERSDTAAPQFDRRGVAPLYQELAEWLEHKVRSGEYPKGCKIPGDNQLAAQLGVSIITVRAAMKLLIEKRLIARYAGKGTFVINEIGSRSEWGINSTEDLVAIGFQTAIKLLSKGYVRPPPSIAAKFGLEHGSKLFCCETLRINRGEPFVVTDVYLSPSIGHAIEKIDLDTALKKKRLVNTVVQDTCHIVISDIKQTMGAELAGRRTSRILGVRKGAPLLTVERDYFTGNGTLVQVGRASHRVDHYRYTTNLKRVASR